MPDRFIIGKEGIRTLIEIGGGWIEEIAPGAPDDPFAWWNNPEEVARRAKAAAQKVYEEATFCRAHGANHIIPFYER